ncbi:MAG TPA: GIY-YIG nuclease family protein, partial [Chloroflexota bacterium]|nr:GIY-YIG nuclease family protein [Chloroflexota bacterium]
GRLQAYVGPERGSARAAGARKHGSDLLLLNPTLRKSLPERPGVYLMKDERGKIIYIGKAKNLKKRIVSYYNHPLGYKRKMDSLLETVRDLEIRVVGSELEALILESRLIKAHLPQFNVQQKYHHHYPFIKVDVASHFPRVFAAREVCNDGARYFGPFRSKRAVDTVVDLVHRLFPVRTCTRVIAVDGSHRGKNNPCFRYLIQRCLGPCMGGVTGERYRTVVEEVLEFLGGGNEAMLAHVEEEMFRAARRHDFERAARLRDALQQARRLLLSQQLLTGAIERTNLVIVCPSVAPGAVELFGIRHGRLFEQCSIPSLEHPAVATIGDFVDRLGAAAAAPPVVGNEELDAIIIIGSWLARYGESRRVVQLPARPDHRTVGTLLETARVVLTLPPDDKDEWNDDEGNEQEGIADE